MVAGANKLSKLGLILNDTMVVEAASSDHGSPGSITQKSQIFSFVATKMACKNDGGGKSQGYVQVASAGSCRMRKIEGVGTFELMFVCGLL